MQKYFNKIPIEDESCKNIRQVFIFKNNKKIFNK